jgi:molecular chaperone DnaJ
MEQQRTPFGVIQNRRVCPHCQGKGKIISDPCNKCKGSGRVQVTVKKEVNIPAGIDDEQSLALRGQGDAGTNGGARGDAIVVISVRPDPVLTRRNYDVFVDVPITYSQAVLGAEIVVPTIDGKVQYNIPEGTQSGTRFRLRGKGIKYLNGRGRGDQYVTVNVEIPKKITRDQRKALEEELNAANL